MRSKRLEVTSIENSPVEQALALDLISGMDLLRLKAIARLYARGLSADVDWADLLQEALVRVLQGSRRPPPGVPVIAFLAGVMRSIRTEHRRRGCRQIPTSQRSTGSETANSEPERQPDPAPDPERWFAIQQELSAIDLLFANDPSARLIVAGLAQGLSPEEIRVQYSMSEAAYDSTRKRMRRALLRKGLARSSS